MRTPPLPDRRPALSWWAPEPKRSTPGRCLRTVAVGLALVSPLDAVEGPAFRDVAQETGLLHVHDNGDTGTFQTPEVVGPGVALFDYDRDGDLDVFLGQGGALTGSDSTTGTGLSDRLYRNDLIDPGGESGPLRFVDVTEASGLVRSIGYNMGAATGDYDSDGWVDLYVTNLAENRLLRNSGDGTFEDTTTAAGAQDRRWSVPATFFDFDRDGHLDLFVGNYHRFRADKEKACFLPNGLPDYCGPLAHPPEPDRLLRNRGDGTFQDVTLAAGLGIAATALGAVAADFDADGFVDLYVANDQMANFLWMNQGDGTFVEDALLRGAAFDRDGKAQASMGVVAGDLDGDGDIDLFMSHLLREHNTLYLNDGQGLFHDRSREGGLLQPSWPMTGFGTVILDYDGDGIEDLFVANGAVHRIEEQIRAEDPHPLRMENQLFRGLGGGRFEEVPSDQREAPVQLDVSRGLAVGDLDNDGDPDLVITNSAGPVRLLLNQRAPGERWVGVRLLESDPAHDALGAHATVVTGSSGNRASWKRVHTDGSFSAASDPRLLFPLASGTASTIRVRWLDGTPKGALEEFAGVPAGRYSTLHRGRGQAVEAEP